MRSYGPGYLQDLTTSITTARDSVNPTSYSTDISNTTVHSDRTWLRSNCVDAADDALNHISGIKDKLDTVLTKITQFYNEVDETSGTVSDKVGIAQGLLATLNPTISMLCESLLGTGQFQGVRVTPAIIDGVMNNLLNATPYYTSYYMSTVTNEDGTYNFDSLEDISAHIDERVAAGEPITAADLARVNALSYATMDYIDSREFTDEELSELLTQFVSRFYTQDFESVTASTVNPGCDIVADEECNTYNRIWYNYSLTPSGAIFSQCLDSTMATYYNATYQDYRSISDFRDQHINAIQFNDCLMSFCRENQTLALPYIITDWDEYSEYRNNNCIDPDVEFDPSGNDVDGDHYRVRMPFFGELHITRSVQTDGSFSDPGDAQPHNSYISTITYSNDFGPCDFRYTFSDVNGDTQINNVQFTTVWSCEEDFCRDIEQSQINADGIYINSTRQDVKPWLCFFNASNVTACVNGFFITPANAYSVQGSLPSAPNLGGTGWTTAATGIAWACALSGVPPIQVAGGLILVGGRILDFADDRSAAEAQNALLDQYNVNRDENYNEIYFCRNTQASGSYYADNTTDPTTVNALPNYYINRNEAQMIVNYSGSNQVIGENVMNSQSCETLCAQDLGSGTYPNFSYGVRRYYTMFQTTHRNYPSFDELSTDDVNDVCNSFRSAWWNDNPGQQFRESDVDPNSISISGINLSDY